MRVTSRDGVFDCTEDCEREVTAGTRVILDFETEGQVFGSCDGGVQSGRDLVCEVWIGSDDKVLSFTARESAAGNVWRVGSAEVPTVVERIATGGDRYALTGTMTDGRIAVGETIIEADGSGQTPMVAVVGQTGGWASAVPAHASALAVRADGGLSAVFIIDDVQTIGAQTVGTADEMTLVRARFDADGAVTEVDSLLTAHRSLKVLAAALAADGSGYLVGSASSAIAAPTLAAGTWVLRVAADGSVAGEMLAADLYGGAWHLAADGARAIVTTGQNAQAEFHRLEGASIVARSTLANAYVTAVALDGETIAALVQTQNSGLDFGDGLENGQTFVVTLDDALAVTGHGAMVAPIVPTAAVYGLTFDGGALVALIGDAIVRLDDHLGVAARTALPWAHQVRVQSASPHDGGVAFLFQTIAPLVEFDGLDIAGQGTRAIVDLDAP